jgi:hypothetical protein
MPREPVAQRARCRKGRVMHRVNRVTSAGLGVPYLESQCRKGTGIRGVKTTHPRASGPESDWSFERYWYPDCTHCPADDRERADNG